MRVIKVIGVLLVVGTLVFMIACQDVKDKVNERTKQEKDFTIDFDLPLVDLGGESGACVPGYSFGDLLGTLPGWEDVEDHIESIELTSGTYTVTDNQNSGDGALTFFIGDDLSDLEDIIDEEAMAFAETDTIQAGVNVEEADLIFTDGGQTLVDSFLGDMEGVFGICGRFEPDDVDVSMNIELSLTITVTFIPLD